MPARSVSTWKLMARSAADHREAHHLGHQPAGDDDQRREQQPRDEARRPGTGRRARAPDESRSFPWWLSSGWRCVRQRTARARAGPGCPAAARAPSRCGCSARSAARRRPSRARTARSNCGSTGPLLGASAPAVAVEEGRARLLLPGLRGGVQPRQFVGVLRRAAQRAPARVVEGAQHARHVAQRRMLGAALLERPRGLAFEIDDHEVVARHQHLAEVVVAVEARAPCGRAFEAAASSMKRSIARRACQQPLGVLARRWRAGVDSRLARAARSVAAASARTVSRTWRRSASAHRLGIEGRVAGAQRRARCAARRCAAPRMRTSARKAPCGSARGDRRRCRAARPGRAPGRPACSSQPSPWFGT